MMQQMQDDGEEAGLDQRAGAGAACPAWASRCRRSSRRRRARWRASSGRWRSSSTSVGEAAGGDRAAQLAKEAKALADALEVAGSTPTTVARQQQLFRRLLDAGRSLEKDEREDTNKREAKVGARAATSSSPTTTNATGSAATEFREPTWEELRGLSADERRAILEYFKRINAATRDGGCGAWRRRLPLRSFRRRVGAARLRWRRVARARAGAQPAAADTMAFYKALDLEADGKYKRGRAAVSRRAAHARRA